MKWRAKVLVNMATQSVEMVNRDYCTDGVYVVDWTFSDRLWAKMEDGNHDSLLPDCVWVKVEIDDAV